MKSKTRVNLITKLFFVFALGAIANPMLVLGDNKNPDKYSKQLFGIPLSSRD
jgi:hypothetical protein